MDNQIKLKSSWYKGKSTEAEKDEVRLQVVSALPALDILRNTLEAKSKEIESKRLSKASYDNPNWGYKQAHQNGYLEALEEILNFLPKSS